MFEIPRANWQSPGSHVKWLEMPKQYESYEGAEKALLELLEWSPALNGVFPDPAKAWKLGFWAEGHFIKPLN